MTTDAHTITPEQAARRAERDDYLSEIRSAREAYLHPADDVSRTRAALRLMVLLTRAPDVEASMRARQQLIVPGWDEREWQRDAANLRAHIGATHVHTESNVRAASIYAHSVLVLGRRGDMGNAMWRLISALTAARLICPRDGTLGSAVGAHGQQPARWWLDVVALLDDECEGARPHAITQVVEAHAPPERHMSVVERGDERWLMTGTDGETYARQLEQRFTAGVDPNIGTIYQGGAHDPIALVAQTEGHLAILIGNGSDDRRTLRNLLLGAVTVLDLYSGRLAWSWRTTLRDAIGAIGDHQHGHEMLDHACEPGGTITISTDLSIRYEPRDPARLRFTFTPPGYDDAMHATAYAVDAELRQRLSAFAGRPLNDQTQQAMREAVASTLRGMVQTGQISPPRAEVSGTFNVDPDEVSELFAAISPDYEPLILDPDETWGDEDE